MGASSLRRQWARCKIEQSEACCPKHSKWAAIAISRTRRMGCKAIGLGSYSDTRECRIMKMRAG
ncbi:MAG TPA: hypothetical protein PK003_07775, partial [Bacillota bacterium]|nr:hypothetical protein [Bacillota bacterium]